MYPKLEEMYDKIRCDKTKWGDDYFWLETDEDRVKFTLKLLQQYNMCPGVHNEGKSVSRSTEFRDKANKLYTTPRSDGMTLQLDEIIETYTKSVAYAPPGSQELSLAYSNRSAALFTARLYGHCLQDIERALKLDYPDNLKAKVFVRKARCLIALSSSKSETEKALKEARRWLEKMDLNNSERESLEKLLNNPEQMASIEKPRILLEDERNMPEIPNDNPEIPGASAAVELKYSDEFGRLVVATRDIEPGELLVIQPAYASVVDIANRYSYCGYCLKQTWSAIPCDHCVEVIYCSEPCRDAAWNDYHDVECWVLGPLLALEITFVGPMALRLTVRAVKEDGNLQALKDKLAAIESTADPITGKFTGNVSDPQKYESIYTLERNTENRSVIDLFLTSLESSLLLYMLATRTTMFGEQLDGNLDTLEKNEWVTFVGGLIMRHHQIIATNWSSVSEIGKGTDARHRGSLIAPFTCLFNHSCNNVTTNCTFGKNHAMFATDFIKKGEQIFNSYGPCYIWHSKTERQEKLSSQFFFDCDCVACIEDWPLHKDLPSYKKLKLSKRLKVKLNKRIELFIEYNELVHLGVDDDNTELVIGLVNLVKFFNEHVRLSHEATAIWMLLNRVYGLRANRRQSFD